MERSRKRAKRGGEEEEEEEEEENAFGGILGWGVTKPFVFLTPQLEAESQRRGDLERKKFWCRLLSLQVVCVCVYLWIYVYIRIESS